MGSSQNLNSSTKSKKVKAKKESTNMKTSKVETLKTISLTALIAGIIAFGLGVWYESQRLTQMKAEAAAIVKDTKAESLENLKQ